jgi:predicted nucleic acid-binding protein
LRFLLDTVVLSETRKARANANVVDWLLSVPPTALFVSVVSLYEIRRGIALAERRHPEFAAILEPWLASLRTSYADRILAVDVAVADRWGRIGARIGHIDADLAIAATALEHGLAVATRNGDDFLRAGAPVLNPFVPRPVVIAPPIPGRRPG